MLSKQCVNDKYMGLNRHS